MQRQPRLKGVDIAKIIGRIALKARELTCRRGGDNVAWRVNGHRAQAYMRARVDGERGGELVAIAIADHGMPHREIRLGIDIDKTNAIVIRTRRGKVAQCPAERKDKATR